MSSTLHYFRLQLLIMSASLLSLTAIAQVDPGTAVNYGLFTGAGAITNTGISQIGGNVGSHVGAVTGFESPTTVSGSLVAPGSGTETAKADLLLAAAQLHALTPTTLVHAPTFGNDETILAGVHHSGAASTLNGTLTLDAENNPNALFVFQISGAFSTSASASILLINQAKAANVYFIATGEMSIGAESDVAGTWIANDGAMSMGLNSIIQGRMLSVVGAITTYQATIIVPENILLASGKLLSFSAKSGANGTTVEWLTGADNDYTKFDIERAVNGLVFYHIATITTIAQEDNVLFKWLDSDPATGTSYYRVKATSINNLTDYSEVVKINRTNNPGFVVYPNPVVNHQIFISFNGRTAGKYHIKVYTAQGIAIQSSTIIHNGINTSQSLRLTPGLALNSGYLTVTDPSGTIQTFKLLIAQ